LHAVFPEAGIVWLASYPKSGNTWFRIFLANYLEDRDTPVSINALGQGAPLTRGIASARNLFPEMLGVDAGDFTHEEYDCMRPEVYRLLARRAPERPYIKVHDANVRTADGEPLLPPEATAGAIYFVRNPLDVAVSFANHSGHSLDRTIEHMANAGHSFCSAVRGLPNQLRQRLLTWSGHVTSWIDDAHFPVHVMRYEDMLASPVETFGRALRALGLPGDEERLARAIAFSRFDELRRQETAAADGFCDAPPNVEHFFYQGRAGAWRDHLSEGQVRRVIGAHEHVMRRFGYLNDRGEPSIAIAPSA
jgi:hypothetical protein